MASVAIQNNTVLRGCEIFEMSKRQHKRILEILGIKHKEEKQKYFRYVLMEK